MEFHAKRRETLKHIAAGAGALALGGTRAAFAQDSIRVACIYPLTGPLGQIGNAMLTGARIAADQTNRAGGVLGRKIEIVARDDKASPAESAVVARDVLGSGVKLIIGGLLTAPAMAIVSLLQQNDALYVLTGSQVMDMTHLNYNPNAFRTQVNARMTQASVTLPMPDLYPYLTRWGGVVPDNQQGTDNYRIFGATLKKAYKDKLKKDIEVMDPVLVPFPATDFKVAIARVMSSPIEGLSTTGLVGADYYTFMGQAKQLGLYSKIKVFIEAGQGTSVGSGLGANLPDRDLWTPTYWYPDGKDNNATSKALVKDYYALTNQTKNVDPAIYAGHTGMSAMVNAIRNAKSLETPVLRVALERVEFEAANGPFRFRREDHQGICNNLVLKISPKAAEPHWQVSKVITVRGEDIIEPPSPGQKYSEF
jgi:branched-chain amino acid transport system substrate-binding protein